MLNLRDIETAEIAQKVVEEDGKKFLVYETRKEYDKEIANIDRNIERLQLRITSLEDEKKKLLGLNK